jgi:hypothetical protein
MDCFAGYSFLENTNVTSPALLILTNLCNMVDPYALSTIEKHPKIL